MIYSVDGLEYVFAGDASGRIYRLEGSGSGDAGSANINTERLSALFEMPLDAESYLLEGFIQYRKNQAATVTLTFEYAGMSVFNESVTINIPAVTGGSHYSGDVYYSGDFYYNAPFLNKLTRQKFAIPGMGNNFQVRVSVDGTTDFQINKIGLRFSAGS